MNQASRRSIASLARLLAFSLSSGLAWTSSVLALDAPACVSAEACFLAARAAANIVRPSTQGASPPPADIEPLRRVQERFPGSVWAKRAGLLSGLVLKDRQPDLAAAYLRTAERDLPILEDYLRYWRGQARLNAGDVRQAAVLFESIPAAVPDTLLNQQATLRAGEAWYREGACDNAIELLQTAVATTPREPGVPSALLHLADCQVRTGTPQAAQETLRTLWVRYPESPEAAEAMGRLSAGVAGDPWTPTPEDLLDRAAAFQSQALHQDAIQELQRFLSAAPSHPKRNEAKLKLGTAYVRIKRYDQARVVFEELAGERGPEASEAGVWLAKVYLRTGADDALLGFQKSYPALSLSPDQQDAFAFIMGVWYEDGRRYDEAMASYRLVGLDNPQSTQRADAVWRIGWIQYQTGQYPQAIQTFERLGNGREDPVYAPQALYWIGRSAEQIDHGKAVEAYDALCGTYPLSYYCQLVQLDRPHSSDALAPGATPGDTPDLALSEARKGIWRDVHYQRAMELKALGLEQEASKELTELTRRMARDRALLPELSGLLSEVGAYHQALRIAKLHYAESVERSGAPVPATIWHAAYPTGYVPTIKAYAGSDLDPYLVSAIIREESLYDTHAVSYVGAIGLMQVMPATAHTVARSAGLAAVAREDLFEPDINLRIGVRYVEQLLRTFQGNVIHVIAAYNAGPPAVRNWVQRFGDRAPDEFVELIPYQETRLYVKRVLRSYREYHRLHAGALLAFP